MTCTRRLTFCAGHRVLGHEGKCANPHGHNYAAEITVNGVEDPLGRVLDFGVIKSVVGAWLDTQWDHKFLINGEDIELLNALSAFPVYQFPGNPTAEVIAHELYAMTTTLLQPYGVKVTHIRLWETENCWADVPD